MNLRDEVKRLQDRWPAEFKDGFIVGLRGKGEGQRDKGGYPLGFHCWSLERRNAWWAGCNRGLVELIRIEKEIGADG